MSSPQTAALIALLRESGPGSRTTPAGITAEGGPRAALEARLGLFAAEAERQAAADIAHWRAEGITTVGYADAGYPARLTDLGDRPPLLFLRGELTDADADGVAVIGTRAPTPAGIRLATQVATALTDSGRTVVSGLAAGIDTAAHRGALAAGGRTIAVLGNGLRRVYPAANAELQRRVHVLMSQFWPDEPPSPETFPRRNAVMSGISRATVIVEAGERSGARIQARHALAQGRSLFLMAPLLQHEWARTLARQAGVRVIAAPDELIAELG